MKQKYLTSLSATRINRTEKIMKYFQSSIVNFQFLTRLTLGVCVALQISAACAAELRLHSQPVVCPGTLVLLQDIARIVPESGENVGRIGKTVLLTAPMQGEQRTLKTIELRNILSRLGLPSSQYRLTGATEITLVGPAAGSDRSTNSIQQCGGTVSSRSVPVNPMSSHVPSNHAIQQTSYSVARPIQAVSTQKTALDTTPRLVETLQNQLADALAVYLNHTDGFDKTSKRSWKIKVKLDQDQARALATGGQIEEIFGGVAPYVGVQNFNIQMQRVEPSTGYGRVVSIEAHVSVQHRVVAVRRTLPRGYIITENDLTIIDVDKLPGNEFFIDPTDVVGMETISTIRERNVLQPKSLKRPLLVRKGEGVTVHSKSGGIVVRVNGISQDDGSLGDTVVIARPEPTSKNRRTKTSAAQQTYLARVCGPQTVEVHATTTGIMSNDR